jgi:hypothetical protein
MTPEIEEGVQLILDIMPFAYQDKIADFIWDAFGVRFHHGTISKLLTKLEVTRKKLAVQAAQRELLLRQHYQFKIREFNPDQFVFVNESGSDPRTGDRMYGYAASGVRAVVSRWLQSRKRVSVLSAYTIDGFTSITVEGTCVEDIFETLYY